MRAVCSMLLPPEIPRSWSGRGQAELLEEDVGELAVVVLAGVHQRLAMLDAQKRRDGGQLHELRTVPDDRQYVHGWVEIRKGRRAPPERPLGGLRCPGGDSCLDGVRQRHAAPWT